MLSCDAADVAFAVTIADILDRRFAVHMLKSRLDVDDETAVVVPRVFVIHSFIDIDINTAERVDDLVERLEINKNVVVSAEQLAAFSEEEREAMQALVDERRSDIANLYAIAEKINL